MKAEEYVMSEDLLRQYIDGELDHRQMHFVERQMQEHELWQDVYDGVIAMREDGINIEQVALESRRSLDKHIAAQSIPKRAKTPIWRYGVAACLIGVLFAGTYFTFSNLGPQSKQESLASADLEEDSYLDVEIITISEDEDGLVRKSFDGEKISEINSGLEKVKRGTKSSWFTELLSSKKLKSRKSRENLRAAIDNTSIRQQGYYEIGLPQTDRQLTRHGGPNAASDVVQPRSSRQPIILAQPGLVVQTVPVPVITAGASRPPQYPPVEDYNPMDERIYEDAGQSVEMAEQTAEPIEHAQDVELPLEEALANQNSGVAVEPQYGEAKKEKIDSNATRDTENENSGMSGQADDVQLEEVVISTYGKDGKKPISGAARKVSKENTVERRKHPIPTLTELGYKNMLTQALNEYSGYSVIDIYTHPSGEVNFTEIITSIGPEADIAIINEIMNGPIFLPMVEDGIAKDGRYRLKLRLP